MTPKQRLLTALKREIPDRLPVTTHHLMTSYLRGQMGGMGFLEFFDHFGLDAIHWTVPHRPRAGSNDFIDPKQGEIGFLNSARIVSNDWRIEEEVLDDPEYKTVRYTITTPGGKLTTILQSNEHTAWVIEHLVKEPRDIDLIGQYMTMPACDIEEVNRQAVSFGERGLIRGHICGFEIYGQPGTWQDAACLYGIENLIMATYDDPEWVHELLGILHRRKVAFVESLAGANYDILELGGGDASSTVISPGIFDEFVAPYDSVLIEKAHAAGQRIAYHTCGGMMPFLERIAAMKPDAMETFTPKDMGGDVRLAEAKQRIGDKVCLIGGFDQFHFFTGCTPEETRREVRRCFEAAGGGGGYILCPSDHFFEADRALLEAFADEAGRCVYH